MRSKKAMCAYALVVEQLLALGRQLLVQRLQVRVAHRALALAQQLPRLHLRKGHHAVLRQELRAPETRPSLSPS